jgi:hypothetical protein
MRLLFTSILLLLTINVVAKDSFCNKEESLLKKALKQLNLKEEQIHSELYVEKVLPYSKEHSVLVIPKIISIEGSIDNNQSFDLDAYILIVENNSGKIINKYFEPEAWISDAVMLSSIEIDTAPYLLQTNKRAFGIVVNYVGSSRPNPYDRSDLTLYVTDGSSLKPVLKNYLLAESRGEWDTNCAGDFEGMTSVLLIDKQKSNDWYTIIVKQTITKTKNFIVDDNCESKEVQKIKKLVLKFNNKEYK